MSEASDLTVIADIAGRPERLATSKQWRAVITRRQLERDTPVKLEYRSGRVETARAGDCAALQPLFDEIIGPMELPAEVIEPPVSLERISEPPPAPIAEPLQPIASLADEPGERIDPAAATAPTKKIVPLSEPSPWAAAETVNSERVKPAETAQPAQETGPAPPFKKKTSWGTRIINTLFLVGAIALIRAYAGSSGVQPASQLPSSSPTAPPIAAPSTSAAPAPAAVPSATAAPTEPATTYYATRTVALYTQASDTSPQSTQPLLNRGDTISGVAEGTDWIRIVAGPATGNFVSRAALRTNAPPTIDTATAGDYYLVTSASATDEPTDGATVVISYAAGAKLTIQGTVNGFAEVSTAANGVDYIPWTAFGGEGGKGEKHFIRLYNNCTTDQKVILSISIDGNWQGDGFWPVPLGHNARLNSNTESPIEVDSAEIYYSLLGPSFVGSVTSQRKDQVLVNRQVKQLRRAVPVLNDGEYVITLCSG